jgi:hypothetical protein
MNQSQEQTKKCGNCGFGTPAEPETKMDDIPDMKEIKCSKDGHNYEDVYVCDEWKPIE